MSVNAYYTRESENISKYGDLYDLLLEEKVYDQFVNKGRITMVGSYLFSNGDIWYSFPKYFSSKVVSSTPSEQALNSLRVIINVIERLRCEGKNLIESDRHFNPVLKEKKKQSVNIISLSEYIVKDYIQNGIYYIRSKSTSRFSGGRVSLSKTVLKETPIICGDSIIYPHTIKVKITEDRNSIVTQLHAFIVNEAIQVYEKVHGKDNVIRPEYNSSFVNQDLKQYSRVLNQALIQTFSDREIGLIKALIAWCDATFDYQTTGCTNCFDRVWEWVNDFVFGNVEGESLKDSERPQYYLGLSAPSYKSYVGSGNAKPDTIYFNQRAENDYTLYVYDAKYYVPVLVESEDHNEIFAAPANADIVKQVAYLKRIRKSLSSTVEKYLTSKNVFLMPQLSEENRTIIGLPTSNNELYEEIGYALPGNFDTVANELLKPYGLRKTETGEDIDDRVYLYVVNCSMLYDCYLKKKKIEP